jgi:tRNA (cmo5U34)-methyltransferase
MNVVDFSFADHAADFDSHIGSSIPGYQDGLLPACTSLSRRFVQRGTNVIDVGCSTGRLLASTRDANQATRPDVSYIGIDCVSDFNTHWDKLKVENISFETCDACSYAGFHNISLAYCIFTIQFIRSADKLPLLRRIFEGMVEGGALIIAEKTVAETGRMQDAITFPYYDFKIKEGFSEREILDKERSLRGQMTLWTEGELKRALQQVGFREIEPIWRSFMFGAHLALK